MAPNPVHVRHAPVIQGAFLGNRPRVALPHHRAGAVQLSVRGSAMQLPPSLLNFRPSASGQRLPEAIQKKMESFFGADFSDVRVHVGNEASSIGALAFTHGSDLYFAHGQYNPDLPHGQRLLGHELAHVVQQRVGRVRNPFGAGIAVVQDPGLEAEAERMGLRIATAFAPPVLRPRTAQAKPAALVSPARPPFTRNPPPPAPGVSHLSRIRQGIAPPSPRRSVNPSPALVRRQGAGSTLQAKHHFQNLNAGMYLLAYSLLERAVKASASKAGKELWELTQKSTEDHLVLEDNPKLSKDTMASTSMRIGDQTFSKDVDTSGDVLKGLKRDDKISIFIEVNPKHEDADNTAICAETLVHEYALHAIPFLPLITSWRDKDIRTNQIVDYWQSSRHGGKNDGDYQHYLLATDKSEDFKLIRQAMEALFTKLGVDNVAEAFRKEVESDIKAHSKHKKLKNFHNLDLVPVSFILK